MKKTIFFSIFLNIFLIASLCVSAHGEYYNAKLEDMRSQAYLLVNVDTQTVVFAQNPQQRLKCASLVKTATACVVVDNCENLDETVTVSESALAPLKNITSASSDLKVGEEISVRELLYCMMLENSNDAANVLAEHIGGSLDGFVVMMNDFAAQLGCENTNFTNAHGLDEDGEYSCANDIYLMTKYAVNNSVIADMAASVEHTVPATNMSEARELDTWCDILDSSSRYYYEYAKGFKSGSTDEAKRCASVVASKDGYTYIGVVLGCPSECIDGCGYPDNTALYEARRMLRWAFRELEMITIATPSDILTDIKVTLSTQADHVRLVPQANLQALLLDTVDHSSLEFVYELPDSIQAPVEKGQVIGTVSVKYADAVVATAQLVAGDSVERSFILYLGHMIKQIVFSPYFIVLASVVLLGVVIYILRIYSRFKSAQRKTRKRLRDIKQGKYERSDE